MSAPWQRPHPAHPSLSRRPAHNFGSCASRQVLAPNAPRPALLRRRPPDAKTPERSAGLRREAADGLDRRAPRSDLSDLRLDQAREAAQWRKDTTIKDYCQQT